MKKLSIKDWYESHSQNPPNSIAFVDVGCSAGLATKWAPLYPLLDYVGFDPNIEECARLTAAKHPFRKVRYFPYAISGSTKKQTMYKTSSIYCYSLLRPNHDWLKRFSYWRLFEETGTGSVLCVTLDSLFLKQGLSADIIKLDTQGMELPILHSGKLLLQNAFCVETETGFVENYQGETTYAEIDCFLREMGFLLFDMTIHRVGRNNLSAKHGRHQPLWCEAVWFYDYIGQNKLPTVEQAHKSVCICQALGFYDFGLELASYYVEHGLLKQGYLDDITDLRFWEEQRRKCRSRTARILSLLPPLFSERLGNKLLEIL